MALRIATAAGDEDGDLDGHTLLRDEVVENVRQRHVRLSAWAVVPDDERCFRARDVLRGNIHRNEALVVDGMRLDDERLWVLWIDGAEDLARDAGIEELAVLRLHRELLHLSLRHAFDHFRLRSRHILRTDDKIPLRIHRWVHARLPIQPRELRCPWPIQRTRRRLWAFGLLWLVGAETGDGDGGETDKEDVAEESHGQGVIGGGADNVAKSPHRSRDTISRQVRENSPAVAPALKAVTLRALEIYVERPFCSGNQRARAALRRIRVV